MVRITAVEKDSPAGLAGLVQGDRIEWINGQRVEDFLDFLFLTSEAELECELADGRTLVVLREHGQSLGLNIDQGRIARCGCNCLFCFVSQLPAGLRKSLYVKDEDYRHSFLYGNYITGSNLRERDIDRIGELGLSPLYISVHSSNPEIRHRMLGGCGRADILELLRELTGRGVEIHTQIVLCPGINDGEELERTVTELEALGAGVLSLAVVPVGLSAHRQGLPELQAVTASHAAATLSRLRRLQRRFRQSRGSRFVFAADEFYLLADSRLPAAASYEGFPQIENGVGLVRDSLEQVRLALQDIEPGSLNCKARITVLTGRRFAAVFSQLFLPMIEKRCPAQWRVIAVENTLLGETVTVAGLLSAKDILRSAKEADEADYYLLPGSALNVDGFFLDGLSLEEMKLELAPATVIVAESPAEALLQLDGSLT
jgi:putative radical SAM enzyme (TIGR03279 family)